MLYDKPKGIIVGSLAATSYKKAGLCNTATLSNARRATKSTSGKRGTSTFNKQDVILIIRGVVEQITIPDDEYIILGRSDQKNGFYADVDLSPYDSSERGVSREHARLFTHKKQLIIIDMHSTNGTFLNGEQLASNEPALIHKGDNLRLGNLSIQVLFS